MTSLRDDTAQNADYRHEDPATDQALEWYIRIEASGEAGMEDRLALEAWLARTPENRAAYDDVRAMWNCPELTVATAQLYPPSSTVTMPANEPRPIRPRVSRRGWLVGMGLAASLLLAVSFGPQISEIATEWTADYTTSSGKTASIVLPDGSRVQLNSRTALSLDFADSHRGVTLLRGEAWFEVAHDTTRPFTVTAGYGTVHVTGTSFDVSRDEGEDTVHLVTGRIYLTSRNGKSGPLELAPGEAARADASSITPISPEDAERRLAWRDGWVVLSGTPLREALSELQRYTSAHVMTVNTAILDTPVSGSFRIGEADDAIRTIVTAAGGTTSRIPGTFIIIR